MKKVILILTLCAATFASQGQSVVTQKMKTSTASTVDSIMCVGTTSNYLYIAPKEAYHCASFLSQIRRISTAMGGTLTLQGSIDGTNYATTNAADTIHVTNGATDGASLIVGPGTGLPYSKYRFKCNGLASDTMWVKIWFTGRQ